MRILIASDYFYPHLFGGGEKEVYEIAKRLSKDHEVHVITRKLKGLAGYEKHEGLHIHRVFIPSKKMDPPSPIDTLLFIVGSFFKSLRLGDFDIYCPSHYSPVPPLWASSKVKRRSIATTVYDIYSDIWVQKYGKIRGHLTKLFERTLLNLSCTKVLTISNSTKRKLAAVGIPEKKIEIIYCGVNINKFDQVKAKKSDIPRIIYLGRLIWYKHVDDLLRAFSKLDFDVELYAVGEGPEKEALKNLAKSLGVQNRVHLTGFVDEKKKIELLKSAHVLVLPSTAEGFGIVLIEAMAAGTPVLAADIPALRELIKDEQAGLLFAPRDIDELKTKLELVLKDGDLRARLSENGYDLVRRRFTWDKVAERVRVIFRCL